MEKKIWITFVLILVILLGVFVIYKKNNKEKVSYIEFDKIKDTVVDNTYSFIHVGDMSDELKESALGYATDYYMNAYYTDASIDDLNTLVSDYDLTVVSNSFILFMKDKPVAVLEDSLSSDSMKEQLDKYLFNIIPTSERYYKVISTAEEYIKKVNSKNYTISVFGAESCSYCGLYLPVFNKVAKDYNLNIYYFDTDNYDSDEYDKIKEFDIDIPAECTLDGEDTTLSASYPKPMTIITKNGKEVGCIRGYVTEDVLIAKLKEFNLIKE